MNKQKASLMQEATLWELYHRLLAQQLLLRRLPRRTPRQAPTAISAALTQNLLAGDSLGLAPDDLVTRYLCGALPAYPVAQARPRRKRGQAPLPGWAMPSDALHGVLPGQGAAQASLATGTALAARLHRDGALTVLFAERTQPAGAQGLPPEWVEAAAMATALQLPMLFVTSSRRGLAAADPDPGARPAGLPAIPVQRGDAVALYRVLYESASRARAGGGPTWIDGCDWLPKGGRGVAEDPLARMEASLRARAAWQREQPRRMQKTLEAELKRAGWPLPEAE